MLTVQDHCEEEGQADAAIEQSMLNARKSGPEASLGQNIGTIQSSIYVVSTIHQLVYEEWQWQCPTRPKSTFQFFHLANFALDS